MRTILVPVEQHDRVIFALETALVLARTFESYIEGFSFQAASDDLTWMTPITGFEASEGKQHDAGVANRACALFEGFMRNHRVPRWDQTNAYLSFGWLEGPPFGKDFVGIYGRVFDVTVVGRPEHDLKDFRMAAVEAALFDSGRPVLVAPPVSPKRIGENVLIAWNGGMRQARATASALRLLGNAKRVTVLTVEGRTVPGPTGDQLARHLRLNSVPATAHTIDPGKRSTGEVIVAHAELLDCDLLVKGAYTKGQLRERFFGGTTRHVLANSNVPVLMAY